MPTALMLNHFYPKNVPTTLLGVWRLALAIVTAALIIGSAIVMAVEREPALPRPLGFIAAVIGGLWVLLFIWRGGGRD